MMISLAPSFADIWARRPRVVLTTSFQVHQDTVMVQIDMLHWGFDFGQASSHASAIIGPLAVSVMHTGTLDDLLEIFDDD